MPTVPLGRASGDNVMEDTCSVIGTCSVCTGLLESLTSSVKVYGVVWANVGVPVREAHTPEEPFTIARPGGRVWPAATVHVNGAVPPRFQSGRYYPLEYGGGRRPVPCGHGADVDIRDGLCYPTGTVPRQYQQGRAGYHYRRNGYYEMR